MADNPFDIDALNGINFDSDLIRQVEGHDARPSYSGGSSFHPLSLRSPSENILPGSISVTNSNYYYGTFDEPDSYGYIRYHLPTFGELSFDGVVDGDGNPQTFWIHGFSDNGLMLSTSKDIEWLTTGSALTIPGGYDPILFLFGTYGVTQFQEVGLPGAVFVPYAVFDKDPSVFVIPPVVCFAQATGIETPAGRVAVEDIRVGDMVTTASGASRPVKWVGELLARPARYPRPHEVHPVRIGAGAFGEGVPARELRLSPGHAVYVGGVLVPVGLLVNGATIVQEQVESIRYFHIELDSHDVLMAEGLACESYLDDGNRASFRNGAGTTLLHGRLDPQSWDDACAPMVADGPQLMTIRQMLHARAEALGWTRGEEADLVIEADGATILPTWREGNRYRFEVPVATNVVLRSNQGVLAHVMPEIADHRMLGVAIAELKIDGRAIELDDAALGAGFHAVERHGDLAWRWTDGAARLPVGEAATTIEVVLALVAPSWRRSSTHLSVAA